MLDIGWQELFIVAILAIVVVGPKDLPRALKTVMHYVRKARGMAREFQTGVDEMVREADLDDLKKDLGKISDSKGLENTIKEAVDPTGDLSKQMDLTSAQLEMEKTAKEAIKETEPDAAVTVEKPDTNAAAAEQVKQAIEGSAPDTGTDTGTDTDDAGDGDKTPASTTNS